jgi:hypothetical protein
MKKLMIFLALAAVVGCNQESGRVTGAGGKSLGLKYPKEVSVRAGDEPAKMSFSVERGSFDEPVTIEISGLPSGVEVVEPSTTVDRGVKDVTYHLKAAETAKPMENGVFKVAAKGAGMTAGPYEVKLDIKEHKAGSKPAGQSTEDTVKQEKADLKKELEAQIGGVDANIKVLEGHAATASGDARKKIEDDITDLRKKRDDLQKKHDNIDTTKVDSWDKFKVEARKTGEDLKDAAKRAVDRFKK